MAEIKQTRSQASAALDQTPEADLRKESLSGPNGLDRSDLAPRENQKSSLGFGASIEAAYRGAAERDYQNLQTSQSESLINSLSGGGSQRLQDLFLNRNGVYDQKDMKAVESLKSAAIGLMRSEGPHRAAAAEAYESLSALALRMRDGQKFVDPKSHTGSEAENQNFQLLIDTCARLDSAITQFMVSSVYSRNSALKGVGSGFQGSVDMQRSQINLDMAGAAVNKFEGSVEMGRSQIGLDMAGAAVSKSVWKDAAEVLKNTDKAQTNK